MLPCTSYACDPRIGSGVSIGGMLLTGIERRPLFITWIFCVILFIAACGIESVDQDEPRTIDVSIDTSSTGHYVMLAIETQPSGQCGGQASWVDSVSGPSTQPITQMHTIPTNSLGTPSPYSWIVLMSRNEPTLLKVSIECFGDPLDRATAVKRFQVDPFHR